MLLLCEDLVCRLFGWSWINKSFFESETIGIAWWLANCNRKWPNLSEIGRKIYWIRKLQITFKICIVFQDVCRPSVPEMLGKHFRNFRFTSQFLFLYSFFFFGWGGEREMIHVIILIFLFFTCSLFLNFAHILHELIYSWLAFNWLRN